MCCMLWMNFTDETMNNTSMIDGQFLKFEILSLFTSAGAEVVVERNSLCQTLWSGHRKQVLKISPRSTASITMDLLTSVGLYEIQNLNAWLIKTDGEKLTLKMPGAHYVCVKSL